MALNDETSGGQDPEIQFLSERQAERQDNQNDYDKSNRLRNASDIKRPDKWGVVYDDDKEPDDKRSKRTDRESDDDYDAGKPGNKGNKRGRGKRDDSSGKDDVVSEGEPKKRWKRDLPSEELWRKVWKRDDEIERLKGVMKNKDKRIAKLRDEDLQKVKGRVDDRDEKLRSMKENATAMEEEIKTLKKKVVEVGEELHKRDVTIRDMCNESVELLNKGDIPAQPDDVVAADLVKLLRRCKAWATKWSIANWSSVSPEAAGTIGNTLHYGPPRNFVLDRVKEAVQKGKIPPKIIVNALCNRAICFGTFMRPFDILKFADESASSKDLVDRLSWTSRLLHKQSSAMKCRLRALCIRALRGSDVDGGPGLNDEEEAHVHGLVKSCSQQILGRVVKETMSLLKISGSSSENNTCLKELHDIIDDFVNLFVELDSQNPDIKVRFRNGLSNLKFTIDHPRFSAHRALKLREDEDDDTGESAEDAGIEGRSIDLVVEPEILRAGAADGTKYDQSRVLVKAVVWMVKPADLKFDSAVGIAMKAQELLVEAQPAEGISSRPFEPKRTNALTEVLSSLEAGASQASKRGKLAQASNAEVNVPIKIEDAEVCVERSNWEPTNTLPFSSSNVITSTSAQPKKSKCSTQQITPSDQPNALTAAQRADWEFPEAPAPESRGTKRNTDEHDERTKKQRSSSQATGKPSTPQVSFTGQTLADQLRAAGEEFQPRRSRIAGTTITGRDRQLNDSSTVDMQEVKIEQESGTYEPIIKNEPEDSKVDTPRKKTRENIEVARRHLANIHSEATSRKEGGDNAEKDSYQGWVPDWSWS